VVDHGGSRRELVVIEREREGERGRERSEEVEILSLDFMFRTQSR
jgi:hypothetical protein